MQMQPADHQYWSSIGTTIGGASKYTFHLVMVNKTSVSEPRSSNHKKRKSRQSAFKSTDLGLSDPVFPDFLSAYPHLLTPKYPMAHFIDEPIILGWSPSTNENEEDLSYPESPRATHVSDYESWAWSPLAASSPASSIPSPTSPSDSGDAPDYDLHRDVNRDPTWIPRPRNPFIIFRCHYAKDPNNDGLLSSTGERSVSKRAAEAWSRLPSQQKQHFKLLAELEKKQHELRYPDYRFRPRRPASSKRKASKAVSGEKKVQTSRARRHSDGGVSLYTWQKSASIASSNPAPSITKTRSSSTPLPSPSTSSTCSPLLQSPSQDVSDYMLSPIDSGDTALFDAPIETNADHSLSAVSLFEEFITTESTSQFHDADPFAPSHLVPTPPQLMGRSSDPYLVSASSPTPALTSSLAGWNGEYTPAPSPSSLSPGVASPFVTSPYLPGEEFIDLGQGLDFDFSGFIHSDDFPPAVFPSWP
ncbi:hypothetical protein JAAARDRAFT_33297 [Jaapia argillacea MUCL 33604]|uniref:HMG box domain-containing protein n=1 Tax=Jaapia argillacea MUCL 33604 TaxID=933084 RepID=A0A067Q898_9AGAM|nr:hypothetical protein JAAARDRAFT_33297 [Jaapia argillacea MUCL 33604]